MPNLRPVTLPLQLRDGHLFANVDGALWLLDTGAPASFGVPGELALAGEQFSLGSSCLGLDAASLSQFVGVSCSGLIGGDILNRFDHVFDAARGSLTVSAGELTFSGQKVPMDQFMGIPVVPVRIGSREHRMFFDTGAQVSYLQDDALSSFPLAGTITDFYPGIGRFETDTHEVRVSIGAVPFLLRCGRLPDPLGQTLMMAGTQGIVGNAIFSERIIGYFPRRRTIVI